MRSEKGNGGNRGAGDRFCSFFRGVWARDARPYKSWDLGADIGDVSKVWLLGVKIEFSASQLGFRS